MYWHNNETIRKNGRLKFDGKL